MTKIRLSLALKFRDDAPGQHLAMFILFLCILPLRRGSKDSVDNLPGLLLNPAKVLAAEKTLGV
jgi:hypothetical protein